MKNNTNTNNRVNKTNYNNKGEIMMKNTNAKKNLMTVAAAVLMAGIVVTAFALGGCSNQSGTSPAPTTAETVTAATQAPATAAPATTAPATAAPAQDQGSASVTQEDAVNTALADAGFSAADVQFTKKELDTDDGVKKYEINFIKDGYEYEYDISADTGAILEKSKDLEDD